MFFEVEGKIWAFAIFKDCAEWIGIDLDCIVESDDIGMAKHFVDHVLSDCVFDVILFGLVVPLRIELVHFNCYFFELFDVKGFVDFAEPSSS